MDDTPHTPDVPGHWIEDLDASLAELAAGQTVAGDVVMQELHEVIARLEAKRAGKPRRGTSHRR